MIESIYFGKTAAGIVSSSGISTVTAEVVDLLCEGEIEGIVSGDYSYVGTRTQLGYDSVPFAPFPLPTGLGFLRSIYFNEEPIVDTAGGINFQNINVRAVTGRKLGDTLLSTSGSTILKPRLSLIRTINERLRGPTATSIAGTFPKYYRVLNKDAKRLEVNIRFASLFKRDTTKVDIQPTAVNIQMSYRPIEKGLVRTGFSIVSSNQSFTEGALSSPYMKCFNIELISSSSSLVGWEIKIERLTAEPTDSMVNNQTFVDSIGEIYDVNLSYPNSALAYSSFDAEYFSAIPDRYYDVKMTKVQVPSNYDPLTKRYTGNWNGTFKPDKEWSDNPAWCFYDLIKNPRYGLGKYIDTESIDKWTLYSIGQYCDTLVSDGEGSVEPRFTCNLLIQSREEASKVINDMASIFRSIIYYFNGSLYAVQDSPKTSTYKFTNANVIDGGFVYSNSSLKTRHTVAIIRYNDKSNFYKPAVEYIENADGIKKFGYREIESAAFGCSSRGQAIRFGRWILSTEMTEIESASFKTGAEGSILRPGDVIGITDFNKNNRQRGGRVISIKRDSAGKYAITLDREIKDLSASPYHTLILSNPAARYDSRPPSGTSSTIYEMKPPQFLEFSFSSITSPSSLSSSLINERPVSVITFDSSQLTEVQILRLETSILPFATWVIQDPGEVINEKQYRVINVNEDQDNSFSVSAIEYNYSKYSAIDQGTALDFAGGTFTPAVPASSFSLADSFSNGITSIVISVVLPNNRETIAGVIAYFMKSSTDPFSAGIPQSGAQALEIDLSLVGSFVPTSTGTWWVKVFTFNEAKTLSANNPVSQSKIINQVILVDRVKVSSLRLGNDSTLNNEKASDSRLTNPLSSSYNLLWEVVNTHDLNLTYRVSMLGYDQVAANRVIFNNGNGGDKNFSMNLGKNLLANNKNKRETFQAVSLSTYLRKFSIYVEALSEGTNSNSTSTAPIHCFDSILIDSPPPPAASALLSFSNGAIHISSVSAGGRSDVRGYYVFVSSAAFTYNQYKNGTNRATVFKSKSDTLDDKSLTLIDTVGVLLKVHVLIIFYDQIDKEKDEFFQDRVSSNLLLTALNLNGGLDATWSLDKDLSPPSSETLAIEISKGAPPGGDPVLATGYGFKAWIKIGQNGDWVGQGISKVEIINIATIYPDYKGYFPFYCSSLKLYSYFYGYTKRALQWTVDPDAAGADEAGYAYVNSKLIHLDGSPVLEIPPLPSNEIKGHQTMSKMQSLWTYCGWMDEESIMNPAVYHGVEDLLKTNEQLKKPYKLRGKINTSDAKTSKRYRVFLTNPLLTDYAVIGTNSSNADYISITSANMEIYGADNQHQPNALQVAHDYWNYADEIHGEITFPNGAKIPANTVPRVFSDSPWWKNHPAGFGQGWAGLAKTNNYFDVHLGHLIDFSYLREGFFGVVNNSLVNTITPAQRGTVSQ